MAPSEIALRATELVRPAGIALRRTANWLQLFKFCAVGSSGYAVNLAVYATMLKLAGVHFIFAAVCSFLVAVVNNYTWNRLWTFRDTRGRLGSQGLRFLTVSLVALGANLVCLIILVAAGLGDIPAQATAIVVVTPVSFLGNKLWSFRL